MSEQVQTTPHPVGPAEVAGPRSHLPKLPWGIGDVVAGIAIALILTSVLTLLPVAVLLASSWPDLSQEALDRATTHPATTLTGLLSLWAGLGAAAWWSSKQKGTGSLGDDLGLRVRWKVDLPLGLGVGMALFTLQAVALHLLTEAGVEIVNDAGNTQVLSSQVGNPFTYLLIGLGVGLGAPFFEELFFRGLMLRAILKRKAHRSGRKVFAVVVSSLVFGLMHVPAAASIGGGVVLLLVTGLVGAVLAVLALGTNRLGASILAHVAFNSTTVVLLGLGLGG